ncbi:MAG: antitoxin VapB family protein [Halobacteria archaeon]|nr:antitoxin VapB family protein [Halobacteria archaeon]
MASKTISIKEEAYERLKKRKGDDESFSDVILKLTENDPNDFSDVVGTGIDASWKDLEEKRGRSREDDEREEMLGL